jgi:hypothetical protein
VGLPKGARQAKAGPAPNSAWQTLSAEPDTGGVETTGPTGTEGSVMIVGLLLVCITLYAAIIYGPWEELQ